MYSCWFVLSERSSLSFQLRESMGLCLTLVFSCILETLSRQFVGPLKGLTSFVFYFSGVSVICCLISSALKTIFPHSLYFLFFLVLDRRVNLVPVIPSWLDTDVYQA